MCTCVLHSYALPLFALAARGSSYLRLLRPKYSRTQFDASGRNQEVMHGTETSEENHLEKDTINIFEVVPYTDKTEAAAGINEGTSVTNPILQWLLATLGRLCFP